MTASIIAILAAVVPFAIWLWRRKVAKDINPIEEYRKAVNENNTIIVKGDTDALNIKLESELNKLRVEDSITKSK